MPRKRSGVNVRGREALIALPRCEAVAKSLQPVSALSEAKLPCTFQSAASKSFHAHVQSPGFHHRRSLGTRPESLETARVDATTNPSTRPSAKTMAR